MPIFAAAQSNLSPDVPAHAKYRLIDMGTFGGPASYGTPGGSAVGAKLLSDGGVVAGAADTAAPDAYCDPNDPNAFCNSANLDGFRSHAFRWKNGVLTDLGALPGTNSSQVWGINDSGWIAGSSENGALDPFFNQAQMRAVLWTNDHMIDLGTLPGGTESVAFALNNRGQVVGYANVRAAFPPGYFPSHAFLWQNGVMQDLGDGFSPIGINERGQVIGAGQSSFLWDNGNMIDLTPGSPYSQPFHLNEQSQVVGFAIFTGFSWHPFLWDSGVLNDLGTLGGSYGQASWVNEAGHVVGAADLPDGLHNAFLWKDGVMTDLGNLGRTSFAYAINSKDQVVGASGTGGADYVRAFLWKKGGPMVDLNALIPPNSSLQLEFAVNINERGEIAGIGVPSDCPAWAFNFCGHAFLLIPDGNCDQECHSRVAASQGSAASGAQSSDGTTLKGNTILTPAERLRDIPGQPLWRY